MMDHEGLGGLMGHLRQQMFADPVLGVAWGLEISSAPVWRRRLGVNEFDRHTPWRMRRSRVTETDLTRDL